MQEQSSAGKTSVAQWGLKVPVPSCSHFHFGPRKTGTYVLKGDGEVGSFTDETCSCLVNFFETLFLNIETCIDMHCLQSSARFEGDGSIGRAHRDHTGLAQP